MRKYVPLLSWVCFLVVTSTLGVLAGLHPDVLEKHAALAEIEASKCTGDVRVLLLQLRDEWLAAPLLLAWMASMAMMAVVWEAIDLCRERRAL